MKKKLLLFQILILSAHLGYGQITSLDTVSIDKPATFTSPAGYTTYSWIFDTANINQAFSTPIVTMDGSPLSSPTFSVMVNDSGHWYCFVGNRNTNEVLRIDYGSNPNGTGVISKLGGFGFTGSELEGLDIVKDSSTNKWYGFVVNNTELIRMSFGTSLSGMPVDTLMDFSSNLDFTHQLSIKKYGNQWIGFGANRGGHISRLDFGTSITNVPTCTNIPYVGSYTEACNFTIYNEAGNWYMFVCNLTSNTISRLEFGTDIQNNAPTGTAFGNPGSYLNLPRGIFFLKGCNQLSLYIINEGGDYTMLNFGKSVLDTPVTSYLGNIGTMSGLGSTPFPYVYGDTLYLHFVSFNNKLFSIAALNYTHPDTTSYYQTKITHTFKSVGLQNVTLYCDQGFVTGPSAYCKSVYVQNTETVPVTKGETDISLYPNPVNDKLIINLSGSVNKYAIAYLYNITGQFIKSYPIINAQTIINAKELNTGMYLCKIINGDNSVITKITVER